MSFYIDMTKNSGYPCIDGMPEMPSTDMKKPYHRYFFVINENRNNGYPSFGEHFPMCDTAMKKSYPYGLMLCMGNDINDGYPCIPELNDVVPEKFSTLYFGESHVGEMYYGNIYISEAYCNEKEVFRIRYKIK